MTDYIIVGAGLAGICFAETLEQNGKSFVLVSDSSQNSSRIAGGLYNPVILKRFTQVWKATEQLQYARTFYAEVERKLNITIDFPLPLYRLFHSVEEQNNWFAASDKPVLSSFLNSKLPDQTFEAIKSPFGFGEVAGCGWLDIPLFLTSYLNYLNTNNRFINETFDYAKFELQENAVYYGEICARQIVFADGFGLHNGQFFSQLPLDGTKGELLLIKAPNLKLDVIIKSSVFILPIGNDLYRVGATYNWDDKTAIPTEEAKKELVDNLNEIINCDYEIVDHFAGVRPTVNDRRPLLGTHPLFPAVHVLNGMGTRGVMLAPFSAKLLYDYLENKLPLDPHVDIKRFKKIYPNLCRNEQTY